MTDLQQSLSTGAPPAGWYPDPSGQATRRWWSGATWTDYVEAAPIVEYPQVVVPAPAPVEASPILIEAPVVPAAPASRVPMVSAALVGRDADDIAREQNMWHSRSGPSVHRVQPSSISESTPVGRSAGHKRNWVAGLALGIAILSIPTLGANVLGLLPPLTVDIFSGAPVAVALLALITAFRNSGRGIVLSIVALVISAATLLAGLLVDHAVLKQLLDSLTSLIGSILPG